MKTIKLTCMALAVLTISSVLCGGVVAQAAEDTPITEPVIEKEEKCNPDFDFPGINPHTYTKDDGGNRSGTGDFRVENFVTGVGNNNYLWRGYVFSPSRDVTVQGMWGGSGANCSAGFNGAIFEATITGTGTAPAYSTGNMLRQVQFTLFQNNTPEYVAFSPITLTAGQHYLIAQGRVSSGSGCHYASTFIDYENLQLGSIIIDEWYPQADQAYQPSGSGTGTHLENRTGFSGTTPIRVLVGFRYLTAVVAATFPDSQVNTTGALISGTDDVLFTGLLGNSGVPSSGEGANTNTALYFEVSLANDPSFAGATLYPADDPAGGTVAGPQTNLDFERTVTNWAIGEDPNATYYVRAVAINEFGRTTGDAVPFNILTCANPTSGGTIAAEQNICYGAVPAAFTSTAPPSGHHGDLEYQWQKSTTDASSDFSNIDGANSVEFDETASITQTTWYRRMARVTCDPVDWSSAESSNAVQITLEPTPVSGSLTKNPDTDTVDMGSIVSVTLSSGSGGNGTDELEYRTHNGTKWSSWQVYASGDPIDSHRKTEIEVRTRRLADYCAHADFVSVSWDVVQTTVKNEDRGFVYYFIQDAVSVASPSHTICIDTNTYEESVNTSGKGGLTLRAGCDGELSEVTITGSLTLSEDDTLEIELYNDDDHDKFIIEDDAFINGASLTIKLADDYTPETGKRFIIFTSHNDPGEFTKPLIKSDDDHPFILLYEEDNGQWNVVLTSLAPLLKLEIHHIESPRGN